LSRCFDRLLTFTLSSSRDQEHAQLQAEATQSKTESSNVLPDIESIAKKAKPKAASRGPPSAAAAAAPPSITAASPVGSAGGIGGGASKNRRSSRDRISLAPIHTPQQASSQRQVLAKQASAIAASEGVAALTDDDVNSILGSLFLDQK
jgi:hypothetical protein